MKPRLIQSLDKEVPLPGLEAGECRTQEIILFTYLFICLFLAVRDLPSCEAFSLAAGQGSTTLQ